MNKDKFLGMWHEVKGTIKEKWGKLTDDDIAQINGKFEQLSGKLQKRYGWAKEQAAREINNWCTSYEQRKERKAEEKMGQKEGHGGYHKEEREGNQQQWHQNERHENKQPGKHDEYKDKKRKAG